MVHSSQTKTFFLPKAFHFSLLQLHIYKSAFNKIRYKNLSYNYTTEVPQKRLSNGKKIMKTLMTHNITIKNNLKRKSKKL